MSALDELIKVRGRQNLDPSELHISGTDPVFNSAFKLGKWQQQLTLVLESQLMTSGN